MLALAVMPAAYAQELPSNGTEYDCSVGPLSGAHEVPPNQSTAAGSFSLTLSTTTNSVGNIELLVGGLSSGATFAAIQKGLAGKDGPAEVMIPLASFAGQTGFELSVPSVVPVANFKVKEIAMNPDHFYINVGSINFPNGEIRAQIDQCVGSGPPHHPHV